MFPHADVLGVSITVANSYRHSPAVLGLGQSECRGLTPVRLCVCAVCALCLCVCAVCVCSPAGFPATAYGPVAAAAVAAARGSGRGARGRGGYLAYPQSAGPGKRSVHVLCGCCSLSNFSRSASPCRLFTHPPHKAPHAHTPRATICYDWPRFTQIRAEISSYKAHGPLSLPLWSAPTISGRVSGRLPARSVSI